MVLFIGNYIYWKQDDKKKVICYNISGEFVQLSSLCFLLIVFGWCQGAYYLTIWCSVVSMKCKGQNPMAHASDNEYSEEDVNSDQERQIRRLRNLGIDSLPPDLQNEMG